MREVRVDFGEPHQLSPWWFGVALIVSAGAIGWQFWQSWLVQSELRSARAEVASLSARADEAREKQRVAAEARNQAAQAPDARLLAKVKAFPLDQVLTSVEASKTEGVRLMLLDISAGDGVVRIECDYDNSESLFRYLEKLNSGVERKWELTSLKSKPDGSKGGTASIVSMR